ncbi:MAG: hypothetical protein COB02_01650 [Candidatus Cloacimonadota bacterium]|nr:MAG: hypothetical protein COB02_01650 [Candidatus Cloacimonadota bacterium]
MDKIEQIKRWTIFIGIIFLFICWSVMSIFNSYVTDLLNYQLKSNEFKGYLIQSDQVSGDLLSGFIVSNIRLRRKNKNEIIAKIGTLFVKVNPWKLLSKNLEIELAKITNIDVAVENAEDFFQNLVGILGGNSHESLSKNKLFNKVSCSRMFFFNLNLKKPLGLLFAKDKNFLSQTGLEINPSIRFQGEIQWLSEEIRLVATANDFKNNTKDSSLPIKLELLFNFLSSEGQIAFLSEETPISNIFSMKDLFLDGVISANSKLTFSKNKAKLGADASLIKILGEENLYYILEGNGNLNLSKIEYKKFQLDNLSFDSIWNQNNFKIKNGKTRYLGGLISFDYLYDEKESHQVNTYVYQLQLTNLFHSFGESQIANKVKGFIDFSIKLIDDKLIVSPVKLTDVYYESYPIYIEDLHIDAGKTPLDFSKFLWKFTSKGGSFVGGYIDLFEGSLSKDQFKMKMLVEDFSIEDLDFVKNYYSKKDIDGYLNIEANLLINLKNGNYQLNSNGIIEDAQIEYKRFEKISLHLSSNQVSTHVSGEIVFEENKGVIDYIGVYDEKKSKIDFNVKDFNISYLDTRNFEGLLNGELKIIKEPNLKATFHLKANSDLLIHKVVLSNPEFWYDSKLDLFQFKLVSNSIKGLIKGKHNILNLIQDLNPQSYIDSLSSVEIDLRDEHLQRYKSLDFMEYVNLKKGQMSLKGKFHKKKLSLNLNRLHFEIPNNQIFLNESSKLQWTFGEQLNWSLKFSRKSSLDQITKNFLYLKSQGDNIECKFYDLQFSLLKDAIKDFDVPVRGSLDFNVKVKDLFGDVQANLNLNDASLYVQIPQGETYFKKASASIKINQNHMNIERFLLQKKDAEFYINGEFPLKIIKYFPFISWTENKIVNLDMNLPKLPVKAFKDLLPNFIVDVDGSFEGKLKLTKSLPFPSMHGYTKLNLDLLKIFDKGKTFQFTNLNLDIDYDDEKLLLKNIDGNYDDLKLNLHGEVTPKEDFRFFLKGKIKKSRFHWDYITVDEADISNLFIAGARGRLSGFASLTHKGGMVHYEKMMASLATPTHYFQIPFYSTYEFGLRIQPTGPAKLKSDFFDINILPDLTVQFYNDKVVLEGKISSKDGYINLTRNQFRIQNGSHISFVPFDEEKTKENTGSFSSKDLRLWGSNEFQISDVSSKLGLMWNIDNKEIDQIGTNGISIDKKKNFFDSFLRLSAIAEIGDEKVELNLNGHIDHLDYDLRTNDPNLSKDDIFKMLVSHGVGMSKRPSLIGKSGIDLNRANQVTGASDEMILSSQISAQLEDKIFGRQFERIAQSIFGFKNIKIEPNLIKSSSGIGRFRVGTRLSNGLFISHQQENYLGEMRNETRLKLRLSDEVGLIFKRQLREKQSFDFSGKENEKDVQLGFERRFKF